MRSLCAAIVAVLGWPAIATADEMAFGDRVEPIAELGLRYQIDAEDPDQDEQLHRGRLRIAAGLRFRASETLIVVARVRAAEAGADPRFGHVELGDGLDVVEARFDRAYARLTPADGLELSAGLVEHPAESSAALWDPDLAPAGLAARYRKRLRSLPVQLRPSAFAYLIRPDTEGRPAGLFGGQLAATTSQSNVDLSAAAAAYLFEDPGALIDRSGENRQDSGELAQDFALLEARLAARLHFLSWIPVEVEGTALLNAAADEDRFGFSAGATLGLREWPGDFALRYEYRDIQQDAVLAALPADDHRLATNYRSHSIVGGYQIAAEVAARATAQLFRYRPGDDSATAADEGQLQAVIKIEVIAEL